MQVIAVNSTRYEKAHLGLRLGKGAQRCSTARCLCGEELHAGQSVRNRGLDLAGRAHARHDLAPGVPTPAHQIFLDARACNPFGARLYHLFHLFFFCNISCTDQEIGIFLMDFPDGVARGFASQEHGVNAVLPIHTRGKLRPSVRRP